MSKQLPKPKPLGPLGIARKWLSGATTFFLKCDEKGCPYQVYYDYPHLDLVDTPCPMCGSNLCTAEDMAWFLARPSHTEQE